MHYGRLRRYGATGFTNECAACGNLITTGQRRRRFCDRVCHVAFERFARYGLTPEEGRALEASAGGRCRICKVEADLHIDHDHASGVARGLLCVRCNLGLGYFQDSPDMLALAVEYLKEFQ